MAQELCSVRKDTDYVLVKPVRNSPRSSQYYIYPSLGYAELLDIKRKFIRAECIAIDFETRGNDPTHPDFAPVGVGLSCADYTVYVPFVPGSPVTKELLLFLRGLGKLFIAHNVYFDGHVWDNITGGDSCRENFQACTYALYRKIANEGYKGQRWGLKNAMTDMLGWAAPNTAELDAWLILNGHVKSNGSPDHGEMWRSPQGVLGKYCCADADATYQLFNDVLVPACAPFDELIKFHQEQWLPFTSMLIRSRATGIHIDVPRLQAYERELSNKIVGIEADWFTHPAVVNLVQTWRENKVRDLPPPKKPMKKDGTPSASYHSWQAKCEAILNGTHNKIKFNLNSGKQLRWLYYTHIYRDHVIKTAEPDIENNRPGMYRIFDIDVPATKAGACPMNKNTMPLLGDTGKLLAERGKHVKELSYVHSYLELQRDGILYPSFNVPGTVTGRLGGKEPNIQQCFHPDTELLTQDGWVRIDRLANQEVWAVNKDTLIGQWETPSRVFSQPFSGELICFGGRGRTPLRVTPDHRMLFIGHPKHSAKSEQTRRTVCNAEEVFTKKDWGMAHSSFSSGTSAYTEEDIWRVCMIQADGASARIKSEPNAWRFGFKRERKIAKATEIIGRPADHVSASGVHSWHRFNFTHPLLTSDKGFDLSSLGQNQAEIFASALLFWDGTKKTVTGDSFEFNTSVLIVAEEVQAYFVRCGYHARLRVYRGYYRVYIKKGVYRTCDSTRSVHREAYTGDVYCLTVPSSFVIVRCGGDTYVTGNCPKHLEVLRCFKPFPGNIIIEADASSLEPTILAEFSRDPALLSLYGVGANPNHDVYLFNAAHAAPFRDTICKYYDVANPTKEGVRLAKENCAKIRKVAKATVLAKNYGAGVDKIYQSIRMQGVAISRDEVQKMVEGMDELYAGQRAYKLWLEQQWRNNGGWILNGHGRPMCIPEKMRKDCISRCVQSSGHDILVFYLNILESELNATGVEWYWFIVDFHDETMVQCKEKDAASVMSAFRRANAKLNELIAGNIPIRFEPKPARDLSEAKLDILTTLQIQEELDDEDDTEESD